MGDRVIDPEKVLDMGKAAAKAAIDVDAKGRAAKGIIDDVIHLVGDAPDAQGRTQKVAGPLAEQGGEAVRKSIKYVDDVKAIDELKTMEYWLPNLANFTDPDKIKVVTSDEFGGAVIGVAAYLMEKFDKGGTLNLPRPGAPIPTIPRLDRMPPAPGQVTVQGRAWVPTSSGLLVPQGTVGLDPRFPPMATNLPDNWRTIHPGRGITVTPINPPKWAVVGSKTLGWAGAGLTVAGAGYNQWQQDKVFHPEMGNGERFARAAGNAAVEGGPSAAGAMAGAWAGAKGGAIVGAAIGSFFPGPGTAIGGVVGGLVGGIAGGFAGGKAGAAIGRGIKSGWKKLFG
ncbi:hypothetical protein ACIBG8_23800 [Nonomuraea sp. NPDC050556]|uniref:hypothetical protein n=1 Tax=Nonomuraea sp. NPDC050556 TaxID=3364369 RepID=UPI00378BA076